MGPSDVLTFLFCMLDVRFQGSYISCSLIFFFLLDLDSVVLASSYACKPGVYGVCSNHYFMFGPLPSMTFPGLIDRHHQRQNVTMIHLPQYWNTQRELKLHRSCSTSNPVHPCARLRP
ncbi:hypothetical protein BU24DRAFT_215408 [Aaosphaeria arxii CBS 175.79]|uniref:Uncharacterized protein n=1 Tax=Aaosphaeria arxii CBS 175.79 TaxID=1450172 RepID=A0A6A5XNK3_9PLEO|nr:uncharacterized protein BU24DRAFT_215408 [Aaosphaeria arxii CBS 175.79]KAF2014486.1 hypothetical protein BU24DRAFT_215408 [Aaosphaeria arxii CBS 175.79]